MPLKMPVYSSLKTEINQAYRVDETQAIMTMLSGLNFSADDSAKIGHTARQLVQRVRDTRKSGGGIDAFMQQYDLSSEEGIALMCMAEALLRIPDATTIDKLLEDKVGTANWKNHLGASDSLFVNAATWSLMLTGKLYSDQAEQEQKLMTALKTVANRGGGALIRKAVQQGMKLLGKQFVMGRTISEALKRAKSYEKQGYLYSYDMLGEAAHTADDAQKYFQSYLDAIHAIGANAKGKGPVLGPGLSVKLSALHPRYEVAKREQVVPELCCRLKELAVLAKKYDIGLTVDAEESYRLELSLEIIEAVYQSAELEGWEGFGLAVQAYQKRAPYVIDWLGQLGRKYGRKLMVRLVKGAYWDTEVKDSQVMGYRSYPVYTRKSSTDLSYIYCAKKLFEYQDAIFPQFATHNAHTLATVLALSEGKKVFEFQCLHGMGLPLYDQIVGKENLDLPCRIYAPVGQHEDLLAYLVRRLLENGANTSFVNRITDENEPIEKMIADPIKRTRALANLPHPHIPLPAEIYGDARINSSGIDLSSYSDLAQLEQEMKAAEGQARQAVPTSATTLHEPITVTSPTDIQQVVGQVYKMTESDCERAIAQAQAAQESWDQLGVDYRANLLEKLGDKIEQHQSELMAIVIAEAGKTIPDAVAEVREAVDFCRYYADQARHHLAPLPLTGPTGEFNQLSLHGRGIMLCISPWNFPLAIFVGQVTAALVTGNAVLAKPADQTPLIAARAVELMHDVGFPQEIVQLVPGKGSVIGAKFVANEAVSGVMFTGSTETAKLIQRNLAARDGAIVPLIAETGGQNAMIVDSSALPEQVVTDVVASAFGSAGQRCSALRVLFLQEDIADKTIKMLIGAMAELKVGNPRLLSTDVGPVIDQASLDVLKKHVSRMTEEAKLLYKVPLSEECHQGTFLAPCVFELDSLSQLNREMFGPILHIIRYRADALDQVIEDIKQTGYGLTFGVHSRIGKTVAYLQQRMPVGNIYVNRNTVGAVVGVQPFGGEGLSGTGPKAGGPHYLPKLCNERTVSVNTTASGGNATLLSLSEDD